MSFRCEKCGQAQPPRSKPIMKVIETRNKFYPRIEIDDEIIDGGGSGWEIAKEIMICRRCDESY